MNLLLIVYVLFLLGFLLGAAAILYHIVKYQLSRSGMLVLSTIFISGAVLLLLINLVMFFQIDWSDYTITF